MKKKKLILHFLLSSILYILVSLAFLFAQRKMYQNALHLYSFETFYVPVILLLILLLREKEKNTILYIFDISYIILALFLVSCMILHKPLTVKNAEQLLREEGYQQIHYVSSYRKDSYNNGIVAFAKGNLNIELPKSKLGVYIYEGNTTKKNDIIIVYLENGKLIHLSKIDKNNQLKNMLENAH